jgi:hypothetical protein
MRGSVQVGGLVQCCNTVKLLRWGAVSTCPCPKVEDRLLSAVRVCWGRYLALETRWQGSGEDYITRIFPLCTPHQIPFGWSKQEWDGRGMWYVWVTRRGAYRDLVGSPKGRRPLGRTRHRLEDNIKMDLQVGWRGMDLIALGQDRDRWRVLVNALTNFQVP